MNASGRLKSVSFAFALVLASGTVALGQDDPNARRRGNARRRRPPHRCERAEDEGQGHVTRRDSDTFTSKTKTALTRWSP